VLLRLQWYKLFLQVKGPQTNSFSKEQVRGGPQVLLRLQWQRQEVRGRLVQVDVSLAGLELSVMGGLQDELINLTLDRIEWHLERRRVEARVQGHIRRVQLDNQMLDATHPVSTPSIGFSWLQEGCYSLRA
jgi:hypothetical protein